MSAVSKNYAFISYSSDNQQEAEALRVYFAEQGIACWMAPYDIPAGSSYAAEIVDAIKHSKCLVLLLTSSSQESQHVRRELDIAVSAQIPIIPIQLEDMNLSSEFQYYLGTQQIVAVPAIDASSPSFVKAVNGVHHFLTGTQVDIPEPKPPRPAPKPTYPGSKPQNTDPPIDEPPVWQRLLREKWFLPGVGAVVLVCLLGVWLIFGRSKPIPQPESKVELAATETTEATTDETAASEETVAMVEIGMDGQNLQNELEGGETRQDLGTALQWYLKAAELGDAEAMFQVGKAYYFGDGVEQNYNTAMEWYQKAADKGYPGALVWVGYLYDTGCGVPQDYETALEWYQKAAEAGNASAMYYIGNYYKDGCVVEQNTETALEWYKKAAEAGNDSAMYQLGIYYGKTAAEKDYGLALEWYLKGAQKGHTYCMVSAGNMYANGDGVEKNVETALQWYLKAAELGDVSGMGNAGWAYAYGLGEKADYEKAIEWYTKAADAGDAWAMRQIGTLYENGRGVEQDYQIALSWYQKAAELGDAAAMKAIARLKDSGHA